MTGKQYAKIVGVAVALIAVLVVGYVMGARGAATVGTYTPVTEAELAAFAIACRQSDYNEISRLGKRLFTEGRQIPDHADRFIEYNIGSPDPKYSNYQFHRAEKDGKSTSVTLTVETSTGRVDEFLAEESTKSE